MNSVKINNLSFYNDNGIISLSAKQYDTGRKFIFRIVDNDEPFDLTGCDAYLRIFKADKTQFQGEGCCIIKDNNIIIDTSLGNGDQILASVGKNICELHLTDSDGKSLTTWSFVIDVEPRVHNGDNIDSIDSWDAWDYVKDSVKVVNDELGKEIKRAKNAENDLDSKKVDKTTVATSTVLGLIKSGTDIMVDTSGNVSVNDNSHKHTVSNISDLTTTATELNYTDGVTSNIQTQLNSKVDKVSGKNLSTNDYTTTEKNKLAGIAFGAEVNVQSDWSVTDTSSDAYIKNKPSVYTKNEVDNKFSTLETNIDWKEAVATYNDIATTYPSPQDGWTVNVKDTDYTYRYNGTSWVAISANAIPKATNSVDGLLSKEDHTKYEDANSKKHTHSNKSVIDGITSTLISNWNSAKTHTDSAHARTDATKVEKSTTNGNILINGAETNVYTHPSGANPHGTTKSDVGLGNVPNVTTNDQTPTFTETTTLTKLTSGEKLSVAFGKISKAITDLISHIGNKSNPHGVTKAQVGLGNVDNKSSATIRSELTKEDVTTALGYTPSPSTSDTNTWKANSATVAGYVPATGGKANVFYATDRTGVPGWRDIYPIDVSASVSFEEIGPYGAYAFNVIHAGAYNRNWIDCRMFNVRITWVSDFQSGAETYLELNDNYYLIILPGYDAYSIPTAYENVIPVPRPGDVLQIYLDTDLLQDYEGDGGLGQPEYADAAGYAICANVSVTSTSSYEESSDTILVTAEAVHDLYLEHCKRSLGSLGTAVQSMVISGKSKEPVTIEIVACNSGGVPQAVYSYVMVHDGKNTAKLAAKTGALSSTYGTITAGAAGVTIRNKSGYYLHVSVIGVCSAVIS